MVVRDHLRHLAPGGASRAEACLARSLSNFLLTHSLDLGTPYPVGVPNAVPGSWLSLGLSMPVVNVWGLNQ